MELINLLNSDEFDYPCSWFEDSEGNRSLLMANRTVEAKYIPTNVKRLRIDGSIWVHHDEWIHHDIQNIYDKLSEKPDYVLQIINEKLFIELAPENAA